jgi:polysaccharide pyruvyl transferase WcaK-like protein
MDVLVINHYACNKGDRAILYFVTRELAKNKVNSITVSAHDRAFWKDSQSSLIGSVKFIPWGFNVERPIHINKIQKKILSLKNRLGRYKFHVATYLLLNSWEFGIERLICNAEFFTSLRKADLVISTGGHHITTLLAPDAVSGQLFDMGMVLLSKTPLVLWSQSIGPLEFKHKKNKEVPHTNLWVHLSSKT